MKDARGVALAIQANFLSSNAAKEINVSSKARERFEDEIDSVNKMQQQPRKEIFDEMFFEIMKL